MTIHCSDILAVGDHLQAQAGEGFKRSAVSRHYYATYHRSQAWAHALPGHMSTAGPEGGAHQQFINSLRNPDRSLPDTVKAQSRMLSAKLDVMRRRRVVADYKLSDPLPDGDATMQATMAHEIAARYLITP